MTFLLALVVFSSVSAQDATPEASTTDRLGVASFRESYRKLSYDYGPYNYYATSFGLALDIGGTDRYLNAPPGKDSAPSDTWRDNHTWQNPASDDKNYGFNNFGIGMDVPDGTVPQFFIDTE